MALAAEAIPLATTTSVLAPFGVLEGGSNLIESVTPGAIDTVLQFAVWA
jgi:hypothetical protein